MIRLPSANTGYGFHGTILAARGEDAAIQAWMTASADIYDFLAARGTPPQPEDVRNFLDSVYGRHVANEVLNKCPVREQLKWRSARFLKHFSEIQRQTARGDFS